MNIVDVRKLAWNRKNVVDFLSTIEVGTVKSTHELVDDFILYHGVDPDSDTEGVFYQVLNNMCAGFDYLLNVGDISLHRDNEGMPYLTFIKHSGFSPNC